MNICVIMVTYNRIDLLKECVKCVNDQTYPVSNVIIIDNHSTDGTFDYLEDLKKSDARYIIKHTKENLGGAGGFALGINLAKRLDSDWDLIIDDDAMIRPDFVEKLMAYSQTCGDKSRPAALSGCIESEVGLTLNTRRRISNKLLFLEANVPEEEYNNNSFSCDLATFCGLMVRHDILVQELGPITGFFLWYDDTEYCMRLRKYGDIINVNGAVLDHKVMPESVHKNVFMRTTWKHYYGYRNRLVTARQHLGFLTWGCVILQYIFMIVVSGVMCLMPQYQDKGKFNFEMFCDAMIDGIFCRLGKNDKYLPG